MNGLRQFFVDKFDVRIYPTRKEMGMACAAEAGNVLRLLLAEKEDVNIIFASAPSQLEMLEGLLSKRGLRGIALTLFTWMSMLVCRRMPPRVSVTT